MAEIHNWTGLPAGVKFDPTDEEILKHLEAKVTGKDHPSIHEFIPTLEVEAENGLCYTHPERLPGLSKDGQIRYFFHRLSKAYSTGTRKRGRIRTDEEGSETSWRETGNTQPVLIGGTVKGFKKILVFDAHYQRHQYHLLCNKEEKDGELAVSKVFYLTQPQHYGSSMKDSIRRKTVIYSVLFVAASVSVKLGFDPNILLVVSFFCLSLLRIKNEGYNLGSGNQAGSFPQMDLPASASCMPKVRQAWGNDFTGNQNAVPRPAAQNQNSYSGQVPGNPETGVAAHPGNRNATPRPADQNQDPNYPRVGIGSLSMNPPVTIYSSSGTININNGITYNFSPPCIPRG